MCFVIISCIFYSTSMILTDNFYNYFHITKSHIILLFTYSKHILSIRRCPWIIFERFGLLAINSQLYTTVGKQCTTRAKGRSEIGLFDYRASAKFETWFHLKQEPCCIIGPYKYTLKKAGAKTWSWITRNDIYLFANPQR